MTPPGARSQEKIEWKQSTSIAAHQGRKTRCLTAAAVVFCARDQFENIRTESHTATLQACQLEITETQRLVQLRTTTLKTMERSLIDAFKKLLPSGIGKGLKNVSSTSRSNKKESPPPDEVRQMLTQVTADSLQDLYQIGHETLEEVQERLAVLFRELSQNRAEHFLTFTNTTPAKWDRLLEMDTSQDKANAEAAYKRFGLVRDELIRRGLSVAIAERSRERSSRGGQAYQQEQLDVGIAWEKYEVTHVPRRRINLWRAMDVLGDNESPKTPLSVVGGGDAREDTMSPGQALDYYKEASPARKRKLAEYKTDGEHGQGRFNKAAK